MPHTIQEIARLAGISTGTVSRVLNDRPNVSPKTRERVKRIIEKFDYRPSAVARGLQGGRPGTVMMVVPSLEDPYFMRSINRISAKCREAGWRLILGCSDWNADLEAGYLRQAMDGMVDGLLITPVPATAETTRLYAALARRGLPVVVTELPCPGGIFPSIQYDDAGDARRAVDDLFRQGFRRVAFLACDMRIDPVKNRHAGWLEAHRMAGIPADPDLSLTSEAGMQNMDFEPLIALVRRAKAKKERLAVLVQNDLLALKTLRRLEEAGLKPQKDAVVVGYGDAYSPELLKYPMQSVVIPWQEICDRALETLRGQMETKAPGKRAGKKDGGDGKNDIFHGNTSMSQRCR